MSEYLRYGFILSNGEESSLEGTKYNQLLYRDNIEQIIVDRFYESGLKIQKLSQETKRGVTLALSGGIDSLLIFKVFNEIGLKFKSVNLEYEGMYSEKRTLLKNIDNIDNIEFISKSINYNPNSIEEDKVMYPNTVSHPTIEAYKDIADSVEEGSILVTGDLGDEIFGYTEEKIINGECIPEYLFTRDQLSKVFGGINLGGKDIKVEKEAFNTEIFIFFKEVTYAMWKNVLDGKDIIYMPFYKNFIDLSKTLRNTQNSTRDKSFLYKVGGNFGLNKENMVSSGIKYPVDADLNFNYFTFISNNEIIFSNLGLNIDLQYLRSLLENENDKKIKWKLYSLVLFIKYIKNNDTRFYTN